MRLSELTDGMLDEIEHLYVPPNPNSAVVQLVRDYRAVREELQQLQERITTADNSIVYLLSENAALKAESERLKEHIADADLMIAKWNTGAFNDPVIAAYQGRWGSYTETQRKENAALKAQIAALETQLRIAASDAVNKAAL